MKANHRRLSPPSFRTSSLHRLISVLRTDRWLRGPCVRHFEETLARMAGVDPAHVVATASCTDALAAAGRILLNRLPVIVCPLTYAGTYSWAFGWDSKICGPAWVDCDEDGWPVAPVDVGVELWGRKGEMGAPIVDAAHRFRPEEIPETFEGGTVDALCWSFGPQKELPGVRGGALVLRNPDHTEAARAFLNNGIGVEPSGRPGRKGLMANAEAAFLLGQLEHLPAWRERRQRVLGWYERFFPEGSPVAALMTRAGEASGHLCVLRFPNRGLKELARDALLRGGIECSTHYPVPADAPPGCVELSGRVLSVPCHESMSFADVRKVCVRIIGA